MLMQNAAGEIFPAAFCVLAEGEGFEPSRGLTLYTISNRAH